jgi:hypothetical protein
MPAGNIEPPDWIYPDAPVILASTEGLAARARVTKVNRITFTVAGPAGWGKSGVRITLDTLRSGYQGHRYDFSYRVLPPDSEEGLELIERTRQAAARTRARRAVMDAQLALDRHYEDEERITALITALKEQRALLREQKNSPKDS